MFQLEMTIQELLVRTGAGLIVFAWLGLAHAWLSNRLGDPGPEQDGRVTINPGSHLDVLGLVALVLGEFGWAKRVDVDPAVLRRRWLGAAIVWAGCFVALVILAVVATQMRFLAFTGLQGTASFLVSTIFLTMAELSLYVALLNLLPIPGLVGEIFLRVAAPQAYVRLVRHDVWIKLLLVILIVAGVGTPWLKTLANGLQELPGL